MAETNKLTSLLPNRTILPSQFTSNDAREGELGKIRNPDGSHSTEFSITISDPRINGGKPTVIPSLVMGQKRVKKMLSSKIVDREQQEIAIVRAAQRISEGQIPPKGFNSFVGADTDAVFRSGMKSLSKLAR